jgi:hypothetical protein
MTISLLLTCHEKCSIYLACSVNFSIFKCLLNKLIYSLRPISSFANTDVSSTKMCLDTSVFAKSHMVQREYYKYYIFIHIITGSKILCIHIACLVYHLIAYFKSYFSPSANNLVLYFLLSC